MIKWIAVVFAVALGSAQAQTLTPSSGGTYDAKWRAMQACFQLVGDVLADAKCVETAIASCQNAGVYESCLDSLAKWVGRDISLMQRVLGLKPGEGLLRDPACDMQSIASAEECAARDATGLLLDLRIQMRDAGFNPDDIETPIFHPRPILDCIEAARGPAVAMHCVGEGALACWHDEQGEGPAGTIGLCLGYELTFWEIRMTAALAQLPQSKTASNMQSDWQTSRDSRCALAVEAWGPGSGEGEIWADCMLHLTGWHTLWLETQVNPN